MSAWPAYVFDRTRRPSPPCQEISGSHFSTIDLNEDSLLILDVHNILREEVTVIDTAGLDTTEEVSTFYQGSQIDNISLPARLNLF